VAKSIHENKKKPFLYDDNQLLQEQRAENLKGIQDTMNNTAGNLRVNFQDTMDNIRTFQNTA
jgi:hypothetical protein